MATQSLYYLEPTWIAHNLEAMEVNTATTPVFYASIHLFSGDCGDYYTYND